jgi:hypothetical protein
MWDGSGYTCAYWIDGPDGELYSAQDISIRMVSEENLAREAVRLLCSFLSNDADVYRGSGQMGTAEPHDGYSFNVTVAEWAYMHVDEIDELADALTDCRHSWVAGMMYVSDEDVAAVAAVECEQCERVYQPGDEDSRY